NLGRPLVKAFRLRGPADLLSLADFKGRAGVRGFVVDAFSSTAYGGTGEVGDWALAAEVAGHAPVLLAGGLTAENVRDAIQRVRPYGVDVSSGVEASPGKKDQAKVRAFIEAAKLVSQETRGYTSSDR
ncbi:MAG: phosphoribosylanthranilate isomerase, partial [Nitrospirota bacterium]|nr:phosphoribosylanthranilate isomerase [Nitrospirota bacterium]